MDAIISLISTLNGTQTNDTGGQFQVAATTEFAQVDLVFAHAPVNSILMLDAHTLWHSAVTVQLHETYEGDFCLATTLLRPDVFVDVDVEDPSGKNRERVVDIERIGRGDLIGSVRWGKEEEPEAEGIKRGAVNIKTTIAPVRLRL